MSFGVCAVENVSLTVASSGDTFTVGDEVCISVILSEYSTACGGSFELVYDNSILQIVSCKKGEAFSNINATVNGNYRTDAVKMVWFGTVNPSGGEILNLVFKAKKSGQISVGLSKIKLSNLNADSLLCTVSDAQFYIYAPVEICSFDKSGSAKVWCEYDNRNVTVMFAAYGAYGRLSSVKISTVKLSKGMNTVYVDTSSISSAEVVRIMLFDGTRVIAPVCESMEIYYGE